MSSTNWKDAQAMGSGEFSEPEEWLAENDPKRIAWEKENKRGRFAVRKSELKTPQEILADVSGKREQLISQITSEINAELIKKFIGEPLEIWVDAYEGEIKPVMDELKKRFDEKEWKISLARAFDSQKDGARVCFAVRSK